MMSPAVTHFVDQFSRHGRSLPGADLAWLTGLRRRAIDRFAAAGLPTQRDEDWKYTSLRRIEQRLFDARLPAQSLPLSVTALADLVLPDAHVLVFVDGRWRPDLSYVGPLPPGASLTSLGSLWAQPPAWLEPALVDEGSTALEALNVAFMADGACLRLAPGTMVSAPIQWLFVTASADLAVQPRNLILAGEGSRACVVEHHVGLDGGRYLTNAATRIVAEGGARIEHVKLQQESRAAVHFSSVRAAQGAGSRLLSNSIALGAALARVAIAASLDAEAASCDLAGLYVADGRQHTDHHTRVDHRQAGATSREHYRGVMAGEARAVFNGKLVVHPDAQRSDAFQANHNLLLSDGAEVDTKPELEIYADDVKCGHGATVGQLDEDQVFYLRSRGVDAASARALLTLAFARDIIERIRTGSLRQRVDQLVEQRLPVLLGETT
jgi:Fe-S cluster assembly protein SufD